MVLNLERCVGCNACTLACKSIHGLNPDTYYSRTFVSERGTYPNARLTALPTLCNHCEDAPCVKVCPVGASHILDNGIVVVDSGVCIGCRYCMAACPYDERTFIQANDTYYPDQGITPYEKAMYAQHQIGTVEKCDFCSARLNQGMQPACVQTCPAHARFFGDLDDPNSNVSLLLATNESTTLNPEAGTKPKVHYI